MKQTIYLSLLALLIVTSCKKNVHTPAQSTPTSSSKYDCTCKITIAYIDHCGRDSSYETTQISSVNKPEAEAACKSKNTSASSEYTITTKTCELF